MFVGALLASLTVSHLGGVIKMSRLAFVATLLLGVATGAFGLLEFVWDRTAFLGLSYALRFVEGFTDAAVWVSILGTMIRLYPDHVAAVMAYSDTVYSVAYAVGPAVGGALFDLGGFVLPFVAIGTVNVALAFCWAYVMPDDDEGSKVATEKTRERPTWKLLLSDPSISSALVDNVTAYFCFSLVESILAAYADTLGISPQVIHICV